MCTHSKGNFHEPGWFEYCEKVTNKAEALAKRDDKVFEDLSEKERDSYLEAAAEATHPDDEG